MKFEDLLDRIDYLDDSDLLLVTHHVLMETVRCYKDYSSHGNTQAGKALERFGDMPDRLLEIIEFEFKQEAWNLRKDISRLKREGKT